jgi:hypothetical protein
MMIALLGIATLMYWFTMGATEGFKWTPTPKMVTADNYHIFRSFSTLGVMLMGFSSGFLILSGCLPMDFFKYSVGFHMMFWPVYEMTLNWVNWGTFFPDKGMFVFGPIKFHHPPANLIPLVSLAGLIFILVF